MCDTNATNNVWIAKDKIRPIEILDKYIQSINTGPVSCNTDKTKQYTCDLKCRTRGIQIAAFNCGVILGWREMYLSESITQVALMYLDIIDNYIG